MPAVLAGFARSVDFAAWIPEARAAAAPEPVLALLVPVLAWNFHSRRLQHPATLIGAAVLIAFYLLRMPLGETAAWQGFTGRLMR